MTEMPIVELVARKAIALNPSIGLSVVDVIVLLWLFASPYPNRRRQISSMKNVLKMTETLQSPTGTVDLTDDELTQVVLSSLQRLRDKGLLYIQSAGVHYLKGTLTEKGAMLIEQSVATPVLRRVIAEFGNNP